MSIPIIRTSELRDFGRCQQRWWWAWREGLQSKGVAAPPLWFGTGVHLALGNWYCGPGKKRGPHPAETWLAYCGTELAFIKTQDLTEEQEAKYVSAQELGEAMLSGYVELYGKDEHKLYIQPEKPFRLDIPWSNRQEMYEVIDRAMAIYAGTIDGVWRDAATGLIILDEHKTAKAITTGHLSLDPQAGGYWAVASLMLRREGVIGPKERIKAIEYNFLRKGVPDDRPKDAEGYATNKPEKVHYLAALASAGITGINGRGLDKLSLTKLQEEAAKEGLTVLGERSKTQEAPLFRRERVVRTEPERNNQLRRIQDQAVHMQAVRDRTLPVLKNPTKDCNWDCRFFDMCELQERGGDWEDYREMRYRVADPYADHRKSTDE